MMAGFNHLFIPGPTNIPEQVRQAMNLPMEDMRAPNFPEFTKPLFEDIKRVFKNETGRVFIYPSSGTGAWEAAIENVLTPGDRVLMSRSSVGSSLTWMPQRSSLYCGNKGASCGSPFSPTTKMWLSSNRLFGWVRRVSAFSSTTPPSSLRRCAP